MAILVTGRSLAFGASTPRRFERVRQCEGPVRDRAPEGSDARALLAAAEVPCLVTGGIISGERCLACERLLNFVPAPDRRQVTVRCLWTDLDPLTSIMTPAARLATAPRDAPAAEAARLAADYGQDLLLVVDHGVLYGVVRRSMLEWAPAERRVDQVASRQIWIAPPSATLGDAAAMLADAGTDCILVVDDATLLGMVTRDHLHEVGDQNM